ncbi:unnamed protein product [Amoebophrya sp. A120]|nr:unnamed protein product [Amoebophrya sp. A120]CAD7975333.1 unnamed protein product [Amoebophrya sp. A120]|eukprot:GSA120T00025319001.1
MRAAEMVQYERGLRGIERGLSPHMSEAQKGVTAYKLQKAQHAKGEARMTAASKHVAGKIAEYDAQITAQEKKYKTPRKC